MPAPSPQSTPRYRRRILGIGLIVAGALFSIGAPIYVRRIESDLEQRVPEALAEGGFVSIAAEFSGQDGTLSCPGPLADPELATEIAYDVDGVHKITLDRTCRVNSGGTDSSGDVDSSSGTSSGTSSSDASSPTSADEFASIAGAVAADPQLSYLSVLLGESTLADQLADPAADPVTLFAPTDEAFDALPADVISQLRSDPELLTRVLQHHLTTGAVASADLVTGPLPMEDATAVEVAVGADAIMVGSAEIVDADHAAGNGVIHVIDQVLLPDDLVVSESEMVDVDATLADGAVTLTGVVASEVERARLLNAVTSGGGTPVDQLTVDPDDGLDAATTESVAALVAAMPANLVSGVAGFDGSALYLRGVYRSDAGRDAVLAVTGPLGVSPELEPAPVASEEQATALETALNEYVAANPIRFEPGSSVLTADAGAVIDEIASQAGAVEGVTMTVEGHTDSDGDPGENLALSQQRAQAVRTALIERGLDAAAITAEGFGSDDPVLVDGVEDKDASRRVEFRIEAAA